MSNFKDKAQVFVIGLSIGLLIAGAFFILKLDDYFKELSIYKKVSQTFSSHPDSVVTVMEKPDAGKEVKTKKNKSTEPEQKEEMQTTSAQAMDADTLSGAKPDSLLPLMAGGDDFVVRKDELLSTKTIEVFNLNPTVKSTAKDSLLQKVSGIKDDKTTDKQFFNVEFWESPLHYKGYKLSKYKMVLYGYASADNLKLYRLDDVIYLKTGTFVYRLDYVSDFKPYERITDEQIISKLK
ncbi:MAG: hypothetical protein JWP12_1275 [Bacteroidetes bacterium]|nr:hypothetical protein [Bacteroidota bacterium]